jgi:ABC-type multidrug transport system ATPase subunit
LLIFDRQECLSYGVLADRMITSDAPTSAAPLLRMAGISKRFGATQALRGVSLELQRGEVLALIGENGAGKSTLMKVLSGAVAPDEGSMELAGRVYSPRGPHAARQAGVAMIYQELNLAQDLSIEDNIMLGQERSRWGTLDRAAQRIHVRAALARVGHADLPPETRVGRLSVGMQQLVEIARALASEASVIVFDEPTSSLAKSDVERLFEVIARLRQEGLGVIYISHFLEEIRRVCDSYTVLRDGETVDRGRLAAVSEAHLVAKMAGRKIDELYPLIFVVGKFWGLRGSWERDERNWCAGSSRSIRFAAGECKWDRSIRRIRPGRELPLAWRTSRRTASAKGSRRRGRSLTILPTAGCGRMLAGVG